MDSKPDSADMDADSRRNIVIIGGGIIGCTIAYYLTRHPKYKPELHKITLLEATAIAAGASGKAGGLLGLWAYPECLVPLSYKLHEELAQEHGGDKRWGYRRVGCGHVDAVVKDTDLLARAQKKARRTPDEDLPNPKIDGAPEGTADGATINSDAHASPGPLPIQSSTVVEGDADKSESQKDTADGANGGGKGEGKSGIDDTDKDWEKLPKQDEKAAGLMKKSVLPDDLDWIESDLIQRYNEMGTPGTTATAQVHPFYFTTAMAEMAKAKGVDIKTMAKVTKIRYTKAEVQSVEYEDRTSEDGPRHNIDGVTDVVVAAGPWTGKLLPKTRVEGLRAHSVVFEVDVSPYAVFTNIQLPADYVPDHRAKKGQKRKHRGNVDPEVYARPGKEVYACGEPDPSIPLPETADLVQCDDLQCEDLRAYMGTISPTLGEAPIKTKQACYIPRHMRFGEERSPLVGETSVPGLYVASGHTCWGIQNGPATGFLMAELLLDGEIKSANIDKLNPATYI